MQYETPILLPRKRQLSRKKIVPSVECFLVTMLFVIAVQGTYLAYVVGILTNLERRFGISSKKSGSLLSFYDIGHTVSVVLIGFLANDKHLPRITATGVLLSAVSMFVLALPVVLFGAESSDEVSLSHEHEYILRNICDPARVINGSEKNCELQEKEHFWAFCILIVGQILAGIAAAPFNTVAYVYVDNNLEDKTKSPFYLSIFQYFSICWKQCLLSSMYAFAPAFGFALSAVITRLYTTIFDVPSSVAINNDEWIGAWWLGFVIFGLFYLAAIVPLLFFPKNLLKHNSSSFEMQQLRNKCSHDHDDHQLSFLGNEERSKETFCGQFKAAVTEFPGLIKNRVFISMIIGWMFGSYLTSGYCTYLPKYIETQFGHSASVADTYAVGCNESQVKQLLIGAINQEKFIDKLECNLECQCNQVDLFNPWNLCLCADNGPVETGLYMDECNAIFTYIATMFTGLFLGNLFFMTTMMIVLRSVYDDEKVLALSFASCTTNIMGFIPGPIIFGWIIDEDCLLWHSKCPHDRGNCVIYDNKAFRQSFHLTSAGFQFLAVISVVICYIFSHKFTFPEEEGEEEMYDEYVAKQADGSYVVQTVL
ncbi:unnamed protein product [Wuchereria bancrofti]|uniref:Solute carrier organic anion transporter family member n=1 Tax=Wuchereria bancrofti TaxID=6293 RepID=A0A3P7EYQ7_WUCBA|nr:unnamed protein product [Wuchereria bancrofti]